MNSQKPPFHSVPPSKPPSQKGVGLVEIMVSLAIGMVLSLGLIQIFAGNQQSARVQEAQSRLQENSRFAIEFLTRDITEAGYLGCAGDSVRVVNTLNNAAQYNWNFTQIVEGFEAVSGSAWDRDPASLAGITSATGGRDILTLRRTASNPAKVINHTGGNPPGSADIQVTTQNGFNQFDIAMVTDCVDSAIFQISSMNPNTSGSLSHNTGVESPGNATNDLGKKYSNTAEVIRLMTITYYISNGTSGLPSLFRKEGANAGEEIIEGLQDLQILYGVDSDGDRVVNRYVGANLVTDWKDVISVRFNLLLQSLADNITTSPQAYSFNGVTYDGRPGNGALPTDRRLRRAMTTTVNLRNRTL